MHSPPSPARISAQPATDTYGKVHGTLPTRNRVPDGSSDTLSFSAFPLPERSARTTEVRSIRIKDRFRGNVFRQRRTPHGTSAGGPKLPLRHDLRRGSVRRPQHDVVQQTFRGEALEPNREVVGLGYATDDFDPGPLSVASPCIDRDDERFERRSAVATDTDGELLHIEILLRRTTPERKRQIGRSQRRIQSGNRKPSTRSFEQQMIVSRSTGIRVRGELRRYPDAAAGIRRT